MYLTKEYRRLLEPFLRRGFTLQERRRNTHIAVLDPSGRLVTMLPSTPSDHRSLMNTRAELRRAARNLDATHRVASEQ